MRRLEWQLQIPEMLSAKAGGINATNAQTMEADAGELVCLHSLVEGLVG